jgi:hypothetical protein
MRSLLLLLILACIVQTRWQLPVTIRVLQDVDVKSGEPVGGQRRGTLYIGRAFRAFVVKKGETFQMIQVGQEGGCRIRIEKREYDVSSCPWLDGFRDHQTDFYEVLTRSAIGRQSIVARFRLSAAEPLSL